MFNNQKIFSKEFKHLSVFLNFFLEREINIGLRLHLSFHHFYLSIFLPFVTIYIGVTRRWVINDSRFVYDRELYKLDSKEFNKQYNNNPKEEENNATF